MQGLESAESTQKRGPFFNLSSLPTSSSFSTPTPSMELFSSLGGEGGREGGGEEGEREGGRQGGWVGGRRGGREGEDHQQPAVSVPKEVCSWPMRELWKRGSTSYHTSVQSSPSQEE